MRLDSLNKRIDFIQTEESQDDYGKTTTIETVVYSCWACLYTQTIKQMQDTVGTLLEGSVNFIIRKNHTYEPVVTDQIRYNKKLYDIIQINDVSSNYPDYVTVVAKTHES